MIADTANNQTCNHSWNDFVSRTQGDGTSYDECILCGWVNVPAIRRQAFEEALEIVGKDDGIPDSINTASRIHFQGRNELRIEVRTKLQEKINELEAVK